MVSVPNTNMADSVEKTCYIDLYPKIQNCAEKIYDYARLGTPDSPELLKVYAKYYEYSEKIPSVARLIYKDTFHKMDDKYQEAVQRGEENVIEFSQRTAKTVSNTFLAEKLEPVKSALAKYSESFGNKYSNSDWIRIFTIDTKRILMDEVKSKANIFHKFKVAFFMKRHGIKSFFKG